MNIELAKEAQKLAEKLAKKAGMPGMAEMFLQQAYDQLCQTAKIKK